MFLHFNSFSVVCLFIRAMLSHSYLWPVSHFVSFSHLIPQLLLAAQIAIAHVSNGTGYEMRNRPLVYFSQSLVNFARMSLLSLINQTKPAKTSKNRNIIEKTSYIDSNPVMYS